jgi:hypothetical protein
MGQSNGNVELHRSRQEKPFILQDFLEAASGFEPLNGGFADLTKPGKTYVFFGTFLPAETAASLFAAGRNPPPNKTGRVPFHGGQPLFIGGKFGWKKIWPGRLTANLSGRDGAQGRER